MKKSIHMHLSYLTQLSNKMANVWEEGIYHSSTVNGRYILNTVPCPGSL